LIVEETTCPKILQLEFGQLIHEGYGNFVESAQTQQELDARST